MRKYLAKIGVSMVLFSSLLPASSIRNQILLMEASENIRLNSQEIVKNYLYYYNNPKKNEYKEKVVVGIENLDKYFRVIARSTKDSDSKDVLAFLDYSKEKMEEVLDDPLNKKNPTLMLDYSEILLEGAESISNDIEYTPSNEEKMLMKMKDITFLIERITKFYMAVIVGEDGINYTEILRESIEKMDANLSSLDEYAYTVKNLSYLADLKRNWMVLKRFYLNTKNTKVANIVLLASLEVRKNAHVLELYHSKNQ